MLRFLTAGESHGKGFTVILDGFPAGCKVDTAAINGEFLRRQAGYGRGKRMKIEQDKAEIVSGLKDGFSFGAPIAIFIKNNDFSINKKPAIYSPRPGHADLAGGMKYNLKDYRLVLERASARETVARVAVGALCKQFLGNFKISVFSHVIQIGSARVLKKIGQNSIFKLAERSPLRCVDKKAEKEMIELIDEAAKKGDSLGGVFEVIAQSLPPGLGSYAQWDMRLDGQIASAIISVPAVKAVEIGSAVENSFHFGSDVQDEIFYNQKSGFIRKTNRAGGLEGGITNGGSLVVRGYMKPIATLSQALSSVDIRTKKQVKAFKERADVCAVPSAGVIAESMLGFVLMRSFLDKFGSDSLADIKTNYKSYIDRLKNY
ncbi:MAG: chorismate synthase [Candidatus Omnitrophica bacterium]|nr:chorismate synthase [Candidatus Omnitrophota bacterium]